MTNLHNDALEAASHGGRSYFQNKVAQLVTSALALHACILALLVVVLHLE